MMRVWNVLAASVCSLAVLAGPAQADTLQDALWATENTNPELENQREQMKISEEQLAQATGARLPTVEVTGQYGPETIQTNRVLVLDQGGRQIASTSLQATQPLYAGGRILAGIREAGRALERLGRAAAHEHATSRKGGADRNDQRSKQQYEFLPIHGLSSPLVFGPKGCVGGYGFDGYVRIG